jgi:hypothetical protein
LSRTDLSDWRRMSAVSPTVRSRCCAGI